MGLSFLERDLEDIIFEADKSELSKRGLCIDGRVYRQLQIGNYGRADMVSFKRSYEYVCEPIRPIPEEFANHYDMLLDPCIVDTYKDKFLDITVYELKKDELNISTFLQAIRYCKGISQFLEKRNTFKNYQIRFWITLIGRHVNLNSDFIYAADMLNNLSLYTYQYNFDGIIFKKQHGFILTNSGL